MKIDLHSTSDSFLELTSWVSVPYSTVQYAFNLYGTALLSIRRRLCSASRWETVKKTTGLASFGCIAGAGGCICCILAGSYCGAEVWKTSESRVRESVRDQKSDSWSTGKESACTKSQPPQSEPSAPCFAKNWNLTSSLTYLNHWLLTAEKQYCWK